MIRLSKVEIIAIALVLCLSAGSALLMLLIGLAVRGPWKMRWV